MKVYDFMFLIILFLFILPIFIYLKMRSLGLSKSRTIFAMICFLRVVPKAHFQIFNELKYKNKKIAFKILIRPFIELPKVITLYSCSVVQAEAKYRAITELVSELNNQEKNALVKVLKKEGIKVKIKGNKIKEIKFQNTEKNVKNNVYKRIENQKIWNAVLNHQVGTEVKNELMKELMYI